MIARVVRELTDIGNTDLRLRAQLQVGATTLKVDKAR
jgi:hypothetical protein